MDNTITSFITSFVVSITLITLYRYLGKRSKDAPNLNVSGQKEFRVQKFFYYFGIYLIGLAIIALSVPIIFASDEDILLVMISFLILAIFFGSFGIYYLFDYRNTRVYYDEKKIYVVNFQNKEKSMFWSDLTKISINPVSAKLVFRSKTSKLKFNQFVSGVEVLLDDVQEFTGISTEALKKQANPFKV